MFNVHLHKYTPVLTVDGTKFRHTCARDGAAAEPGQVGVIVIPLDIIYPACVCVRVGFVRSVFADECFCVVVDLLLAGTRCCVITWLSASQSHWKRAELELCRTQQNTAAHQNHWLPVSPAWVTRDTDKVGEISENE